MLRHLRRHLIYLPRPLLTVDSIPNNKIVCYFGLTSHYACKVNIAEEVNSLQEKITLQGNKIRSMKSSESSLDLDVKSEVATLKTLRRQLDKLATQLITDQPNFDREDVMRLAEKQDFFNTAYHLSRQPMAGLISYGELGARTKRNLLSIWEEQFIRQQDAMHLDTPEFLPETILKASGHLDKFADHMVKDSDTGQRYRLDHLVKQHLEQTIAADTGDTTALCATATRLDSMSPEEQFILLKQLNIKAPKTGNELSEPFQSNLMLHLDVDGERLFMRPELAQGIFSKFPNIAKHFARFGRGLPFAAGQIGSVFRNEVGTKMLRMRAFTVAELEHFCDPEHLQHRDFDQISDTVLPLWSACDQLDGSKSVQNISVHRALEQGIIAHETLGYFLTKCYQYLLHVGVDKSKVRIRQHMSNEMAHYAKDCWDFECQTHLGWIEVAGCADRGTHDLTCHSEYAAAGGEEYTVERMLESPVEVELKVAVVNKSAVSKVYRNKEKAQEVRKLLAGLTQQQIDEMEQTFANGEEYNIPDTRHTITQAMVTGVDWVHKMVYSTRVLPCVVEPSFGVDRILYTVLDHSYTVRENDDKRTFFALKPVVCPIKAAVVCLSHNLKDRAAPVLSRILRELSTLGVPHEFDDSKGSIGRRYSRLDQLSVPYVLTVDMDTITQMRENVDSAYVTLRERDSMEQITVPVSEVCSTVDQLSRGALQWSEVFEKWPKFTEQKIKRIL